MAISNVPTPSPTPGNAQGAPTLLSDADLVRSLGVADKDARHAAAAALFDNPRFSTSTEGMM